MQSFQKLEIKTGIQVLKPIGEVFETIVDPDKMKNYFISKSSGYMKEGETLIWKFPEMDMEFPIKIGKIEKDSYISYYWNDLADNTETFVEINLSETETGATFIQVTEKSRPNDETGIQWLKRNTEGWANFLACLKAWMEYGIHLRKGAFNLSQLPKKEN
jgi:uncharacterized protein YndB with AHSA1/START domain